MDYEYEQLEEQLRIEKKSYQKEIDKLLERKRIDKKQIDELADKISYLSSKIEVEPESRNKTYQILGEASSRIDDEYKKIQRKLDNDYLTTEKEHKKRLSELGD